MKRIMQIIIVCGSILVLLGTAIASGQTVKQYIGTYVYYKEKNSNIHWSPFTRDLYLRT